MRPVIADALTHNSPWWKNYGLKSGSVFFSSRFRCGSLYFLDRVAEIMDILEASINRGKADVGDFIQLVEFLHHHFADLARRNFTFARARSFCTMRSIAASTCSVGPAACAARA